MDEASITWAPGLEGRAHGRGASGRVYEVGKAGDRWRWTRPATPTEGAYASGAHLSLDAAMTHAQEHEERLQTEENDMAKGKKKSASKSEAKRIEAQSEGAPTNGTHPPTVPAGAVPKTKYTESLPCKLDSAERIERSGKLVELTCERVAKESELAAIKETVKALKKREDALAVELQEDSEKRQVEVQEYLLPTNEVIAVRTDTGEVVDTRTADPEDLQEDIPGTRGDEPPPSERDGDIDEPDDLLSEDRPGPEA